MLKTFLLQAIQFSQTVLIQTIQLGISMQLVLFNPKIGPLSGTTTPGQSGPGSNGNEGVLHIPQSSGITRTSPSNCLVPYPGHLLGVGSYSSSELQSVYFSAPANWAIEFWYLKTTIRQGWPSAISTMAPATTPLKNWPRVKSCLWQRIG